MLVAGVAIYLGVVLFPGALTQTERERVMTLMAPGYAEAKWLDATLPPDAVVLEDISLSRFAAKAICCRRSVSYASPASFHI